MRVEIKVEIEADLRVSTGLRLLERIRQMDVVGVVGRRAL